jgi:hypothetical protein
MPTTNHAVLCGACKCAVEPLSNPKAHDKVSCPRCGRSDRFDKVMATLSEYFAHLTEKALAERLAKTARSNSRVKLTIKKPGHRSFRWIAKDVRL